MKIQLKRLLIPALASKSLSSLASSLFGYGIPIFMIHRMAVEGQPHTGTTPEHLINCLNYLKNNAYRFVSLEDLILALTTGTPLPDRSVVFTMDDGFYEQAQVAVPIFREFKCPLTFFVITGLLDQTLWPWDAQVSWIIDNANARHLKVDFGQDAIELDLGEAGQRRQIREYVRNILKELDAAMIPGFLQNLADSADVRLPAAAPPSYRALDWDTARELESRGVQFAPHSRSHRILSKMDRESAVMEILGSWKRLQEELTNPLNVFCYPTGRVLDFGPREIGILKENGFLGAVGTSPGYAEPVSSIPDQVYRLPRFELPDNMLDFIQYCSWIGHARRTG